MATLTTWLGLGLGLGLVLGLGLGLGLGLDIEVPHEDAIAAAQLLAQVLVKNDAHAQREGVHGPDRLQGEGVEARAQPAEQVYLVEVVALQGTI